MEELSLHLSHSQPRLRFLSLVFTISISWLASSDGASCEEQIFKCGDHILGYPFGWKNGGCGDPALQLDCDHQVQKPLLNISGNQYYIVNPVILYPEHNNLQGIMNIKDKHLDEYGNCDPYQSNYTDFMSSPQFHIGRQYNLNFTLWQNCDDKSRSYDIASFTLCNNNWSYCLKPDCTLNTTCKSKVILPIFIETPIPIPIPIPAWLIQFNIWAGFQITWNASEDCRDCDSNGGRCAYDKSSMQFCCECSDKQCAKKWPPGKSKTNKSKIIFIGCSIGGAVLVPVMLYIVYVKRRRVPPTQGFARDFSNYHRNDVEAARPGYMMGSLSIFP